MSIPFSVAQFEKKPNRYMPATRVRVDKLVATQSTWDQAKVDDIAAKGAADGTDPLVHKFGDRYFVGDGHHRLAAAIQRGDHTVRVRAVK